MRVNGFGPRDASFIIVGEAPGAEEERQGIPFVGSSGRLLDDMLISCGINRKDCYITNVVKERPFKNDFGQFYEDAGRKRPGKKLLESIEKLKGELSTVKAKVVIALGAEALRALTGKIGISKWRGSIIQVDKRSIIATYHPAAILRMYNFRAIAELDLKKAVKVLANPSLGLEKDSYKFKVNPAFEEVIETLQWIKSTKKMISFDIETSLSNVRCLGLAWSNYEAICIPFIVSEKRALSNSTVITEIPSSQTLQNAWSEEEEMSILFLLKDIFEDENIQLIAQNFPFDSSIIEKDFGILCNNLWMDTMVAMHCCYSELPKSLDFLCSMFTHTPYYADYDAAYDWSTWVYNCFDASVTFQVAFKLLDELNGFNLYDFYKHHAEPSMIALTRAGNRGMLVDTELRKKLKNEMEDKLKDVKAQLLELTGRELNPKSSKQMKELLYDELGFYPQKNRKTGKITANEEALENLMEKYPLHKRLFKLCLDYRGITTMISNFLQANLDERGRMLTSLNATGTKTGRISSSKTIFGLGGNMQQIPKSNDDTGGLRRIYIAPFKRKLVKADLSQAEARATAWVSQDHTLIKKFLDPSFDVHSYNASLIYKIPESEVTRGVVDGGMSQREKVKRIVHGANYGIKAVTCSKITRLLLSEVKLALDAYISSKPQLVLWWKSLEEEVKATRILKTPFGRQRIFFDRLDDNLFRSAYAFIPQSLVADMVLRAFYMIDKLLPKGAFLVLQVHDEVIVECGEEQVEEVSSIVRKCLELPIEIDGVEEPLIIPAEVSVGDNWKDQVEICAH